MMEETARNEKIEDYLLGRLDESESQLFRIQMDKDPELRNAVKDRQQLLGKIDTLFDYEASKLIKKVQHDAKFNKHDRTLIRKRLIWFIAAATIFAFLFFAVKWSSSSTNEELYATYYEPYTINFVQRGNTNDKNIAEAGSLYRNAEYSKALPLLISELSIDPKNTHIQMAIGISHLELNNYKSTIQTFKPLIDNKDPLYFNQAIWYSALVNLRLDQIDLCKEQLKLLTQSSSSSYSQKAQNLLADLN